MASVGNAGLVALFKMVGAPVTPEDLKFGNAWERAEGGSASFNPFNTTQPFAGASNYNSVGVRNYRSLQDGLKATAQTLLNGHYTKLVQDLRSGKATAAELATDVANSPWGTGSGVLKVLGSGPVSSVPASKSGGGSVVAQPAAATGGASMRDALLQMAMQNNEAIMQGETPDIQGALSLLTAMRAGGSAQGGSALASAPGATGGAAKGAAGSVVQAAKGMLGTPYVWGGTTPGKALDCSGFLQQAYAKVGIKIPRTTYDQVKVGKAVSLNSLQPGDAVFTEPGKNGPNHVGMYVGNGMIQESPHTGDRNKLIPLKDFLSGGFVAARRYVK